MYVSNILDPHRASQRIYYNDRAPLVVVNRKEEPQRALPTLVSFARSYAFKANGPGLMWESTTQEMMEPNVDERERAIGFPQGCLADDNGRTDGRMIGQWPLGRL